MKLTFTECASRDLMVPWDRNKKKNTKNDKTHTWHGTQISTDHTHIHTCILWPISLLLRGAYCGCGDSQNNRFFPLCHPGLQAHYTDWSIQSNLAHNTKDPRSTCVYMCMCVGIATVESYFSSLTFTNRCLFLLYKPFHHIFPPVERKALQIGVNF